MALRRSMAKKRNNRKAREKNAAAALSLQPEESNENLLLALIINM